MRLQKSARGPTSSQVELRKTDYFVRRIDGLTDEQREDGLSLASSVLRWAMLAMSRRRAKRFSELRIHHGPGYRVYFTRIGKEVVILLAGGDKGTQPKDIKLAIRLAKNLQECGMSKTVTSR